MGDGRGVGSAVAGRPARYRIDAQSATAASGLAEISARPHRRALVKTTMGRLFIAHRGRARRSVKKAPTPSSEFSKVAE
jgi:hypothetical protein